MKHNPARGRHREQCTRNQNHPNTTTTDITVALCPLAKRRGVGYNKVASDDIADFVDKPQALDRLNSAYKRIRRPLCFTALYSYLMLVLATPTYTREEKGVEDERLLPDQRDPCTRTHIGGLLESNSR
jgi:hypothetical protein